MGIGYVTGDFPNHAVQPPEADDGRIDFTAVRFYVFPDFDS